MRTIAAIDPSQPEPGARSRSLVLRADERSEILR